MKKEHEIDLSQKLKREIKSGKIKIRPAWYFALAGFLLFFSLLVFILLAILVFSFLWFKLRYFGPELKMGLGFWLRFPWGLLGLAILSLYFALKILRRFDFSFGKNWPFLIGIFLVAVLGVSLILDKAKLHDNLQHRPKLQMFYGHPSPRPMKYLPPR